MTHYLVKLTNEGGGEIAGLSMIIFNLHDCGRGSKRLCMILEARTTGYLYAPSKWGPQPLGISNSQFPLNFFPCLNVIRISF